MNDSTAFVAHTITVTELAYCAGCSRSTVLELLEHDLLAPVETASELRFAPDTVERVRRIHRISIELEVGYPAMGLVLRLLDRIEELERRLRESG